MRACPPPNASRHIFTRLLRLPRSRLGKATVMVTARPRNGAKAGAVSIHGAGLLETAEPVLGCSREHPTPYDCPHGYAISVYVFSNQASELSACKRLINQHATVWVIGKLATDPSPRLLSWGFPNRSLGMPGEYASDR